MLDPDEDVWKGYSQFEFRQLDLDDPSGSVDWATVLGGSAGFVLNDTFLLGLSGYLCIDELEALPDMPLLEEGDYWYLGARMEYLFPSQGNVYPSIHLLIGGGEVTALDGDGMFAEKSSLVMIEPGVSLWLEVYDFMELGAGAGYSFVNGTSLDLFEDDDLSGFHFSLTLRFREL